MSEKRGKKNYDGCMFFWHVDSGYFDKRHFFGINTYKYYFTSNVNSCMNEKSKVERKREKPI